MSINGEIEVLECQGVDPMATQVMPRILNVTVSVFCLAIVITSTTMVAGYVVGSFMDVINQPFWQFLASIARWAEFEDLLFFVPKFEFS